MNNFGKRRGTQLFEVGYGGKHVGTYRSIMEMMAQFGYVSIREVMYELGIPLQKAIDRLRYLYFCGVVERFESETVPVHFYCLTKKGREEVERFGISEEIRPFQPAKDYNLIYQKHDRMLVKGWSCLKKVFGTDFIGFVSEKQLKMENVGNGGRVMDGEFYLKVYKDGVNGNMDGKEIVWRCGLELERTLKSPSRYEEQFNSLSEQIFEDFFKESIRIPMILFLCGNPTVMDRLMREAKNHRFNGCLLYFSLTDDFFEKYGECNVERWDGTSCVIVPAREMNRFSVVK